MRLQRDASQRRAPEACRWLEGTNIMASRFSSWFKWKDRATIPGAEYPGVYAIVRSEGDISGQPFSWRSDIIYIGMTNAIGGIKSRLQQFENTISGKSGHGGAHRVRSKYSYRSLHPLLYVAASHTKCDVTSHSHIDLRLMGQVPKQEYDCLATYVTRFKRLPEFNDKKRSPKK